MVPPFRPIGQSEPFVLPPRSRDTGDTRMYGVLVLFLTLAWFVGLGIPLLSQLLPDTMFPPYLSSLTHWRWESAASLPIAIAVSLLMSWALWFALTYRKNLLSGAKRFV